jgi:hypothetical protein
MQPLVLNKVPNDRLAKVNPRGPYPTSNSQYCVHNERFSIGHGLISKILAKASI